MADSFGDVESLSRTQIVVSEIVSAKHCSRYKLYVSKTGRDALLRRLFLLIQSHDQFPQFTFDEIAGFVGTVKFSLRVS